VFLVTTFIVIITIYSTELFVNTFVGVTTIWLYLATSFAPLGPSQI